MTAEEVQMIFFSPIAYGFYLLSVLVVMVVYYQWRWAKTCRSSVLVLVQKADGHGDFQLAPQEGGSVSLENPDSGTIRTWPINELATIDVPYPGVGFVPAFMQKSIRMVIVSESDWEPMTNRSPDVGLVASSDVIDFLVKVAEQTDDEATSSQLTKLASNLSPAHVKEMIANPAVLGNLIHERITSVVMTVSKEVIDRFEMLAKKVGDVLRPIHFYIGIGVVIILLVLVIFQVLPAMQGLNDMANDIDAIKNALGVVTPPAQ